MDSVSFNFLEAIFMNPWGGAALEMDPDGLCPLLYLQGPMHSNYLNIS